MSRKPQNHLVKDWVRMKREFDFGTLCIDQMTKDVANWTSKLQEVLEGMTFRVCTLQSEAQRKVPLLQAGFLPFLKECLERSHLCQL